MTLLYNTRLIGLSVPLFLLLFKLVVNLSKTIFFIRTSIHILFLSIVIPVCLIVRLIITHKFLDQFASNFD